MSETFTPSRDQTMILRIFDGLKAPPGRFVPVKTLIINWRPSWGDIAFCDAVESLAAAGYLQPNENATQYALTSAGAALPRTIGQPG
jgi:hypothetical protein